MGLKMMELQGSSKMQDFRKYPEACIDKKAVTFGCDKYLETYNSR